MAILLCLLALVACEPARPPTVVKIGLLGPFEGERRELGYRLLPVVDAAAEASGMEEPVEWVILDTGSDAGMAQQRTRELIADPAVLTIVGPMLPAEVEAVAPLVEEAGIAWWPLAPEGEPGLAAWHGTLSIQDVTFEPWGAQAWPGIRRGAVQYYLDPRPLDELKHLETVTGDRPWPQQWMVWRATQLALEAIKRADQPDRRAVQRAARQLDIPAPALYRSREGEFPGIIIEEVEGSR